MRVPICKVCQVQAWWNRFWCLDCDEWYLWTNTIDKTSTCTNCGGCGDAKGQERTDERSIEQRGN